MEMQMLDQDNLDLSKPIKDCKIARLKDRKIARSYWQSRNLLISQSNSGNLAVALTKRIESF